RNLDGMFFFGEAASLGLERWRKYHAEQAAEDTLFGEKEDWEKRWKEEEAILKDKWVSTLAQRLTVELEKGAPFRIIDRADEILGGDLAGVVRSTHMRAAINRVLAANKTTIDPRGVKELMTLELKPT